MNLRESSKLSSQGGGNHGAQSMSDLSDKYRPQFVVSGGGAHTNANRKMITTSVLNTARRRLTSSTVSLFPAPNAVELTVINNVEGQNVLT